MCPLLARRSIFLKPLGTYYQFKVSEVVNNSTMMLYISISSVVASWKQLALAQDPFGKQFYKAALYERPCQPCVCFINLRAVVWKFGEKHTPADTSLKVFLNFQSSYIFKDLHWNRCFVVFTKNGQKCIDKVTEVSPEISANLRSMLQNVSKNFG